MKILISIFAVLLFSSSEGLGRNAQVRKNNQELMQKLKKVHSLTDDQINKIEEIFNKGQVISQGNPQPTKHPYTRAQCQAKLESNKVNYENTQWTSICGHKYMSPLYNPGKERIETASTCIDQFEFPNIPCEYPVVWVRTSEAAEICHVMGKRLCDAHEWEGACDGKLVDPQYPFNLVKKGERHTLSVNKMRKAHNRVHKKNKTWAYGKAFKKGICAQNSIKNEGCNGGNWKMCGSNTYPSGFFPECAGPLKVYDIHGNAAEHMSLPLSPDQMSSKGSRKYGVTEMKGSWFIWDKFYAHQDYCRWRAPYWHGTPVMSKDSHHNYHLGFRCCSGLRK